MDDATQKLVDGLRLDARDYGRKMRGEVPPEELISWDQSHVRAWEAADALEAAQRPPVSPVLDAINDAREAVARGERPSIIIDTDDYPAPERPPEGEAFAEAWFRAGWEAAQRPPVSPEVREALVDTLTSPVRAPGSVAASRVFRAETPEDLEDATALADAIVARFWLPVLDVEKVARWLDEATSACGMGFWATADRDRLAAALVASLPTLTVDGTPADTERNES
jgi:hypothetical protein